MCVQKKLLNRNLRDGKRTFSFREIKGKVFIFGCVLGRWEGTWQLNNWRISNLFVHSADKEVKARKEGPLKIPSPFPPSLHAYKGPVRAVPHPRPKSPVFSALASTYMHTGRA